MKTKYAFQGIKENMAKAIKKDAGISTKVSIEIANFIRGRTTTEAKTILERVLKKKQAIPFKRFTDGVGHRKGAGIAAGRYPEIATKTFLDLIKQCEANAQAKGLSTELLIVHIVAQKGTNMFRQGRQRRRQYKRTHLELVLEEQEQKKKKEKETKTKEKKPTNTIVKEKTEEKTETKKEQKTENTTTTKKETPKETIETKTQPKKTIKKSIKKPKEEQK